MATVPQPLHTLVASIYRWREEQEDDGLRPHLGASLIGHPCARHLWLTFRWAARQKWSGRMLRLFDRGQREEAVIIEELRGIGAEVSECQTSGEQWRVSACGGHFGGSMDGIARGLPGGSAQNWEVLEFKTHNAKSFKELVDKGVEKAKYQHWAQMQTYMALTGMTRANYIAVCKDDDQLHHERIHADDDAGRKLIERGASIVFAAEPPPRISAKPDWYQCKMCSHAGQCHGTEAPLPTCRSCAHATPTQNGTWHCEFHAITIDSAMQKRGCEAHRFIPAMLDGWAEMIDGDGSDNWVRYRMKDGGAEFFNCAAPEGHTSIEIHAAADKAALADKGVDELRRLFGGRIAG